MKLNYFFTHEIHHLSLEDGQELIQEIFDNYTIKEIINYNTTNERKFVLLQAIKDIYNRHSKDNIEKLGDLISALQEYLKDYEETN